MAGLYWLIALLISASAGLYARYWYHRPSEMPAVLTASLSYQTLEYLDWYARRHAEEDPDDFDIPRDEIASHIRGRQLSWRQRNDIILYLKRMAWVYEDETEGRKYYGISRAGRLELETAASLGMAVKEAAQLLDSEVIPGDQAKIKAAAVVAAALRVHARTAPTEERKLEELSAGDIEEAVRSRDSEKIDRAINRASSIVTIASGVAPVMTKILRLLGWWP